MVFFNPKLCVLQLLLTTIYGINVVQSTFAIQCNNIIYVDAVHGVENSTCWRGGIDMPCKTIDLALAGVQLANFTTVFIESGTYNLSPNISITTFQWKHDIAVVGNGTLSLSSNRKPAVTIVCKPGAGLSFLYSSNISIENVVLIGCGTIHTSTSRNLTNSSTFSFLEFRAGLYFLFCKNVVLFQIIVTNSTGVGAVLYNTVGENAIVQSEFSFNEDMDYPGGGGVYIEFTYCDPTELDCPENGKSNISPEYSSNSFYNISTSSFVSNTAALNSAPACIIAKKSNHVAFGHGGGLSVFFKGNAFNNTITVEGCHFLSNTASWGGGLFLEFQDYSHSNLFYSLSSLFELNTCMDNSAYNTSKSTQETAGGGASIGFLFWDGMHMDHNQVMFQLCDFINNSAYIGGGIAFHTTEVYEVIETNTLEFSKCKWEQNVARLGSAMDLSVWEPSPQMMVAVVKLADCNFFDNSGVYTDKYGIPIGLGTVYANGIPIEFNGVTSFKNNSHTALVATDSVIFFITNTVTTFISNTGRNGGAIALFGNSLIHVNSTSNINFINNFAEIKGGAIYHLSAGERNVAYSKACFVRFFPIETDPQASTAKFFFQNNTAKSLGNSIFATSVKPCLLGSYMDVVDQDILFCNRTTWNFSGKDCHEEIATSPAKFDHEYSPYNIQIIPGRSETLMLTLFDDFGRNVTSRSVLTAEPVTPDLGIDNTFKYIANEEIELHGEPETQGELSLNTVEPHVLYTEIVVDVLPCPPGMVIKGSGNESVCKCDGTYGELVECNIEEFQTKLQRGGWMGYFSGELVAGQCPWCSMVTTDNYFPLPQDPTDLNNAICTPLNRKDVLCGHCVDGYGLAANSDALVCVKCSSKEKPYGWLLYILSEFLPITIFFTIVVMFNLAMTTGPVNAFLFFAQVLTTTFQIDSDGVIPLQRVTPKINVLKALYSIPYDIWNLNFFKPVIPSYCLSSELDALQNMCLKYLIAGYPLILIFIYIFFIALYDRGCRPIVCICRPIHNTFSRLRQHHWNLKRSVLNAFATFLLLSYTKFTLVSLYLLTPTPLYDRHGKTVSNVIYLDGNIKLFSIQHLPYLLVAFFFLTTFVLIPPVVLIAPSVVKAFQKHTSWQWCGRLQPGAKIQQFLDAFQGCYKDGTGEENGNKYDFRWFAGLYFVFRCILFIVYATTPDWFMQYVIQQIVCTVGVLLFALLRPYKNDFYNKVDAIMFAILATINTLSMYNYYFTVLGVGISKVIFTFQYILIFCPLVYVIAFLIYHYRKAFWDYVCSKLNRNKNVATDTSLSQEMENSYDFLDFTEQTGRIHEGISYHPIRDIAAQSTDESMETSVTVNNTTSENSSETANTREYGTF